MKIGAPASAASTTSTTHGQPGPPDSTQEASSPNPQAAPVPLIQMPTRIPAAATARAIQPPARHPNRTAMTPNANGSTNWKIHDGTPSAMSPPTSISMATTSMADQASIAETVAPTVAAKACATSRAVPSGMKVAVARAISLFRRAARPAPRKPTHNVRCWTKGIEPGMPPVTIGRTTISASGSNAIAARAPAASSSSDRWRNPSTGAARRSTTDNAFMRTSSEQGEHLRGRSQPPCHLPTRRPPEPHQPSPI